MINHNAMIMETRFDPLLVVLSVLVAIFASYVALNLAHNVSQSRGRAYTLWLIGGALAMGIGIWSMHFVGMLAFEMPGMAMAYDVPLMILSVLVAIGASGLALYIISQEIVPIGSIISGGIAMAVAIAGMHYIGMYSMRMAADTIWNLYLVVLSVIIALGASFGALFILIKLRNRTEQFLHLLAASILLGVAISGMHYTGMLAATFVHKPSSDIVSQNILVTDNLVLTIIFATVGILGLALTGSIGQRIWAQKTQKDQEILGQSEEKFRLLVEAVKEYAIFMLDPEGRITTWNTGAQRITGYSESEVLNKHVSLFYTQADIENSTASKEMTIAKHMGHFEGEGLRVRKDGTTYLSSVEITPLLNPDGIVTGFSKITRDITEIKLAERRMRQLNEELEARVKARTQMLAERERQLRTITNAAPTLIAQLNMKEEILFANDAFCKWFGESQESIAQKTFADILGPERYRFNAPFIKKALNGELTTYERVSHIAGNSGTLSINLIPELNQENQVVGVVIAASDVTKYKEIEAELKNAKEAAEVANSTKSAFLANMSHEIRTPLGAVLGFSELLLNEELSQSEKVNSVEVIKRNGKLLSNIINDILDLSKVEAGKLEIEKVDVPFSEVMKEIGSILHLEAIEKGIDLRVTTEGVVPTQIKTDPLRLRQVLLNIVGNAIKFTSRGSVHVKVKLQSTHDASTKLAFVVKDTGEGIKPDQASRLFTPFTQADISTTRKFGGTGLGLVLSKRLAKALGGDVILSETQPGKGSTFVVTIDPGAKEEILFNSAQTVIPDAVAVPIKKPKTTLSPMKILIVDDSPDNQILLQRILKFAGAQVESAHNGREGVDKALEQDFNLILMDLQMPIMDGYEATKILRESGYTKPIIALTAHAMKEERQKSIQSGFDDHITKPIDREFLIRALAEYTH